MTNWIKVEDQLPRIARHVLVCYEDGTISAATLSLVRHDKGTAYVWAQGFTSDGAPMINKPGVTHWMPLPELPEVKNEA